MNIVHTTIIGAAVGILGNYIATATQPPIPNPWQQRLEQQQADAAAQRLAQTAMRPFREEVRRACRELSRDRVGGHDLSPTEREIWLLLSHADFQTAFADWLMAGGIEEGRQLRAHLEAQMEQALRRGGATEAQIAAFKADYFAALERAIFANPLLAAWRHQRSLDYLREQIDAVRQAAEQAVGIYSPQERQAALERYLEQALRAWDIVDLSNLPEGDIHIATQRLLLRQLYMPLRVTVEVERGHATATAFDNLESQRAARRRREAGGSLPDNAGAAVNPQARLPVGERLGVAHRLVVLGDPGDGKTTLLRWMATAYLLRYQDDPAYGHLPDVATLPEARRLPLLIRCRDLREADLSRSFTDVLAQHLLKTELRPEEAAVIGAMILERIATGEVLLLVDGLDEITNPQVRVQFCQELERTAARYPDAPIIVTSRIVGYRDMPYRMGAGFEHGVIANLTHADKDLFARRWIELTDQHLPQRERDVRTDDLIKALHSSDRIERLTGNPMLLTTLALVKRKVGKLPSRRNKLYAEAVAVLLNWNPRHYETIDEAEAIPQLAYVAYEMGRRGVQRLDADDILTLFEQVRQDYPNVRAMRRRSPEEFLQLLEARSSILIKSGGSWRDEQRREEPVWEFRHLTLQEYLAARALLDRRYPGRNRQHRPA
ncbi:MAG: NACHT domain-containing protein [Chloroflexaceae bacterium]